MQFRPLCLLDVEVDGDRARLVVDDGNRSLFRDLDPRYLTDRRVLLDLLRQAGGRPGVDYDARHPSNSTHIARRAQILRALHSWDYEHVTGPAISLATQPLVWLHAPDHGTPALEHLSHRRAFASRVLAADPGAELPHQFVPLWNDRGVSATLEVLRSDGLVLFSADNCVAVCCLTDRELGEPHLRDLIAHTREVWCRAGHSWIAVATRDALKSAVKGGGRRRALFLIAHQDAEGLACQDGYVRPEELAVPDDAQGWGAAALYVCGAPLPGNLAFALHASTPVVVTDGVHANLSKAAIFLEQLARYRLLHEYGPLDAQRALLEIWRRAPMAGHAGARDDSEG